MAALRLTSGQVLRDEELAPQVVSWTIALTIAAAWLALVSLWPSTATPPTDAPRLDPFITMNFDRAREPAPLAKNTGDGHLVVTRSIKPHKPASALDLTGIFAAIVTGRALAQVTRMIPLRAEGGDNSGGAARDKTAIATGSDAATPGRSSLGSAMGDGAKVGKVQGGAAIRQAHVRINPLPVVTAPSLGTEMADASELGSFIRSRVSQLQSCYEQAGGTDLAGVVALRLTLGSGGSVQAAEIVRRTWSGPGAAQTEACLIKIARGWRVPSGAEGATVTIPISFTRGT